MFKNISENEFSELKKAIAYITLWVAGADNEVDQDEIAWAEKIAHIRTFSRPEMLNDFYTEASAELKSDLAKLTSSLPNAQEDRDSELYDLLAGVNVILQKLPNYDGANLYSSYLSFAKHIAKASGGFLGFGSISSKERAAIGLKMLEPIELIEE